MLGRKRKRPLPAPSDAGSARGREEQRRPSAAEREARIDEVIEQSFPASDPPPWTLGDDRPEVKIPPRRRR